MPKLNEHVVEVEWKSKEEERFVRNIHSLMSFVPVTTQNVDNVIRNLGTMTGQGIHVVDVDATKLCFASIGTKSLAEKSI